MKSILFCLVVIKSLVLQSFNTANDEVPIAVLNRFQQMFPHAKEVNWNNEDHLFIASFYDGDYDKEAVFKTSGKWLKTITDLIDEDELPEIIENYISNKYGRINLYSALLVEQANQIRYEVSFATKKGEACNLSFNQKGKLLN